MTGSVVLVGCHALHRVAAEYTENKYHYRSAISKHAIFYTIFLWKLCLQLRWIKCLNLPVFAKEYF